MPYGNINVDTVTTSTAGGILGAGNASIMKNRIINGAMVINQRAFSGTVTTDGGYTLDRYAAFSNNASKYSVAQSSIAPAGFVNSLLVTSLAATTVGSSDYYFIRQSIEGYNIADLGWGTANAKTVTLSFQVYSSLTGTFGGSLRNSATDRSYPFSYTVSSANTWTPVSITIAGDTSGTWLTTNGIGINVQFSLGAGSTFQGTAGSWAGANYLTATGATSVVGTNGATFYITGVQLEVGSSATGFEYRQYQQELALCQRYCFVPTTTQAYSYIGAGCNTSGNATRLVIAFPVAMRSIPSLTSTGAFADQVTGASGTSLTMTSDGSSNTLAGVLANYNSGSVTNLALAWVRFSNTTTMPQFSAEL
jgi:hypothetical protein